MNKLLDGATGDGFEPAAQLADVQGAEWRVRCRPDRDIHIAVGVNRSRAVDPNTSAYAIRESAAKVRRNALSTRSV